MKDKSRAVKEETGREGEGEEEMYSLRLGKRQ